MQRLQINYLFSVNVRILYLSCNAKKSKTKAKLSKKSRNKCRDNYFWSVICAYTVTVSDYRSTWIGYVPEKTISWSVQDKINCDDHAVNYIFSSSHVIHLWLHLGWDCPQKWTRLSLPLTIGCHYNTIEISLTGQYFYILSWNELIFNCSWWVVYHIIYELKCN